MSLRRAFGRPRGVSAPGADRPRTSSGIAAWLRRGFSQLRSRGVGAHAGRGIDVVVPVHDAREHVVPCVESVLRHARGDWRLVLVDDASRDPDLADWLDDLLCREVRVLLLRNEVNLGFVASANRGLRHAAGRDVVLLNSDTIVTHDFLGRLADCAYATPDTGLVSPFTNNGELCSIPRWCAPNEIPPALGVDGMAALVRHASRRLRPELITAVGFCMFVRAEVVEHIGLLDEASFGRGYGEENDYSLRARAAGFRIRLCDDLFVAHVGNASFGERARAEQQAGNETMARLHPTYHADVQRFLREDPVAPARAAIVRSLEQSSTARPASRSRSDPALERS
jgi:O-antigen biosynthesis protein